MNFLNGSKFGSVKNSSPKNIRSPCYRNRFLNRHANLLRTKNWEFLLIAVGNYWKQGRRTNNDKFRNDILFNNLFYSCLGLRVASAGSGLFSFMANNVVRFGYVDCNALSWGLVFVCSVWGCSMIFDGLSFFISFFCCITSLFTLTRIQDEIFYGRYFKAFICFLLHIVFMVFGIVLFVRAFGGG